MDFRNGDLSGKRARPLLGKLDHARSNPLPLTGLLHSNGHDLGKIGLSLLSLSDDHHEDTNGDGDIPVNFIGHVGIDAVREKKIRQDGLIIPVNRKGFEGKGTEEGEIIGEGLPDSHCAVGFLHGFMVAQRFIIGIRQSEQRTDYITKP